MFTLFKKPSKEKIKKETEPYVSRDLTAVLRIETKNAVDMEVQHLTMGVFFNAYFDQKTRKKYEEKIFDEFFQLDLSSVLERGNNPESKGFTRHQLDIDLVRTFADDPHGIKIKTINENIPDNEIKCCTYAGNILSALSTQEALMNQIDNLVQKIRDNPDVANEYDDMIKTLYNSYRSYLNAISENIKKLLKVLKDKDSISQIGLLSKHLDSQLADLEKIKILDLVSKPEKSTPKP